MLLSRLFAGWRSWITLVQPAKVVAWHRAGFRCYWRRKSSPGRPKVPIETRKLIREMSLANPRWGAPRLHGELLKLGIELSQSTVAKYKVTHKRGRPGSAQSWKAVLANHLPDLVAVDFMVVATATFRVLHARVIVRADRREVVQFGVTANPTAQWLADQLDKGFSIDSAAGVMLRDRDGAYGKAF